MLSIGWTEMMLVAAIALIVVGPRDLPAMLRQIGKAVGSVRRMGNEFKSELNKITAVDEIQDIKKSISAPLSETRASIEKEFNSITETGEIVPSGKIVPSDPNAESVVDEIRAAAGMGETLEENGAAARASIAAAVTKASKAQKKSSAKKVSASSKTTPAAIKPAAKRNTRAKPKVAASKSSRKPRAAKAAVAKSKPAKTNGTKPAKAAVGKPVTKKRTTRKSAASKPRAGDRN